MEKPIIFSSEMVRQILAGKKTMTRRIVKLEKFGHSTTPMYMWHFMKKGRWNDLNNDIYDYSPYGKIGTTLWVRETWKHVDYFPEDLDRFEYKADNAYKGPNKWKPSIHMPRIAARLFLEVADIKIERLNDISEEEAIAEGVEQKGIGYWRDYKFPDSHLGSAKASFFTLWESIHGINSWNANPYVWCVSFKHITDN